MWLLSAWLARTARSMTQPESVGSIPGKPIQIGQTLIFGSSASSRAFAQLQNILVWDFTRTCVSSPMTISYFSLYDDMYIRMSERNEWISLYEKPQKGKKSSNFYKEQNCFLWEIYTLETQGISLILYAKISLRHSPILTVYHHSRFFLDDFYSFVFSPIFVFVYSVLQSDRMTNIIGLWGNALGIVPLFLTKKKK